MKQGYPGFWIPDSKNNSSSSLVSQAFFVIREDKSVTLVQKPRERYSLQVQFPVLQEGAIPMGTALLLAREVLIAFSIADSNVVVEAPRSGIRTGTVIENVKIHTSDIENSRSSCNSRRM